MAATLANAFAQAAIETDIELKIEPAKQYAGWFDQRSRALRAISRRNRNVYPTFRAKPE